MIYNQVDKFGINYYSINNTHQYILCISYQIHKFYNLRDNLNMNLTINNNFKHMNYSLLSYCMFYKVKHTQDKSYCLNNNYLCNLYNYNQLLMQMNMIYILRDTVHIHSQLDGNFIYNYCIRLNLNRYCIQKDILNNHHLNLVTHLYYKVNILNFGHTLSNQWGILCIIQLINLKHIQIGIEDKYFHHSMKYNLLSTGDKFLNLNCNIDLECIDYQKIR